MVSHVFSACIQSLGIILIPWATFVQNFVSFLASIAQLAHEEKSVNDRLTASLYNIKFTYSSHSNYWRAYLLYDKNVNRRLYTVECNLSAEQCKLFNTQQDIASLTEHCTTDTVIDFN